MSNINLAEFLRATREKAGLSQLEVSETVGLKSAQYLSNIERGVSSLSKSMIPKVAKALKIRSEDIVDAILKDIREKYLKGISKSSTKSAGKSAKKKKRRS